MISWFRDFIFNTEEHWITLEGGQHVLIEGNEKSGYTIKGGAGGALNGTKVNPKSMSAPYKPKTKGENILPSLKEEVKATEKQDIQKKGDFSIERETNKAYLLSKDGKEFWVQKRWLREDGSLTPAGQYSLSKAKTKEEQKKEYSEKKTAERERDKRGFSFQKPAWESEKALGFDLDVAWTSSVYKKIRIFVPRSQIQPNGNIPTWLMKAKIAELDDKLPRGWFIEHGGGIQDIDIGSDFSYRNSVEKVYTFIDGELLEIDDEEKKNADSYPDFYYAKHMSVGLAGYEDETILVDGDAIKKMIPTFVGKPVVVYHKNIDVSNLEEKDGTVIESFYNEVDGCAWVKMIIETKEAREMIARGWGVSNCYLPTESGSGGKHHNIPYKRSIKNGIFRHLAIVPNPRYEEAVIYTPDQFKAYKEGKQKELLQLQNSKGAKKMFKVFKKTKEEVSEIAADTMFELENGREVSFEEMVNAIESAEAAKKAAEQKEKLNENTEVTVNGEKMSLKKVIERFNAIEMEKKEAEEGEEEEKEEVKEKIKKAADEKTNAKYFDELANANKKSAERNIVDTVDDRLARGKERY